MMTNKERALLQSPATTAVRREVARRTSQPVKRAVAQAIKHDKTALKKLAHY
jgi:hypothetical protein